MNVKIEAKKLGKYNGFSIILFHGAGGYSGSWDDNDLDKYRKKWVKDWPKLKKYKHLLKGKSNTQKKLSKITTTFSFTSPFWFEEHNLVRKTKFKLIPNNKLFNKKFYKLYLLNLLKVFKVKPPYVLIGFSEGGMWALYFQNVLLEVIGCVCIDPEVPLLNTPEHLGVKASYDKYLRAKNKLDKDKYMLGYYKYKNFVQNFKLNITKPTLVMKNLQEYSTEKDYTNRFLTDCKFTSQLCKFKNVKLKVYFDELHFLDWLHLDEIIKFIKKLS